MAIAFTINITLCTMKLMKERYGKIAKTILVAVGIAGVIVVVAAAPGVLLAAKPFLQHHPQFAKKTERRKAAPAFGRLQKNRLLKIKKVGGKFTIELTKEGKQKFKQIQLENLRIAKPPKWDGKWRIVIFDIPDNTMRSAREILRARLKGWEFYPLQKSVWICPWPCEDEIRLVAELYGVVPYVHIIVAEKITEDFEARKHFGL